MEAYLNKNFGQVESLVPSEEALRRWREACRLVQSPKRRFRFAMHLTNQNNSLDRWKIPLNKILLATRNFHSDNLIGSGGFGGVYKAEHSIFDVKNDDLIFVKKVAVKRFDGRYGQGKKEFLQEIEVLSKLQHQMLVPFLGFCDEDSEMILVYDYAPNGSLDKCIIQRLYSLTWAQRLQICIDVAHGLGYLHDNGIIHRDVKSANILLGHNWEGMIGDFGLSRISKHTDNGQFTLTNVVGTPGYLDPNYARTGKLTKKSDIYSFGVVLLEVLCGRLAVFPKFGDDPEYLLHMFRRHFQQRTVQQIIDPYMAKDFEKGSLNSINTFSGLAYKCLYDNQAQDLTMSYVIRELEKAWAFLVDGSSSHWTSLLRNNIMYLLSMKKAAV